MNKLNGYMCALGCIAGMVGSASAQPLEFVIDPAQSTFDMSIEIDLGSLGGDTDSDSSSLSGSISMELDDPESPSQSWLHGFQAMMDSDLQYNWSPAFLSTADASLTGGMIQYAAPGIVQGPVAVSSGAFAFVDVPVQIAGILSVNYNILFVGEGMQVIDLSTLGDSVTPLSGTLSFADGVVTLTNTIEFNASQPLIIEKSEVGQVIVTGTATMVSTAIVNDCLADLNGDGELDFLDISAFLGAYSSQDPAADLNGDGDYDFLDISAFLASYSSGCP